MKKGVSDAAAIAAAAEVVWCSVSAEQLHAYSCKQTLAWKDGKDDFERAASLPGFEKAVFAFDRGDGFAITFAEGGENIAYIRFGDGDGWHVVASPSYYEHISINRTEVVATRKADGTYRVSYRPAQGTGGVTLRNCLESFGRVDHIHTDVMPSRRKRFSPGW